MMRRQMRKGLVAGYAATMLVCSLIFVMRDWGAERLVWVIQWGVLFVAPGILTGVIQATRRQANILKAGELEARFASQHPAAVPNWLRAVALLSMLASPFGMLFFEQPHLLLVIIAAMGGVLLFVIAALWYDGHAVECRHQGMIVDGVQFIPWESLLAFELARRTNVIRLFLEQDGSERPRELFVSSLERSDLAQLLESILSLAPTADY